MLNIFVTGRMGSGKDEFARYLEFDHNFIRVAFADGIRRLIKRYKPDYVMKSDRGLEIDVGMTMRRWFGDNVWVEEALRDASEQYWNEFYVGHGNTVVSDGRFTREYEECVVKRGWIHVHIEADEDVRRQRLIERDGTFNEAHFTSPADCQVEQTDGTYILTNNGTLDEFHEKIDALLRLLQTSEVDDE